jgi:hypothetical protein
MQWKTDLLDIVLFETPDLDVALDCLREVL